MENRLRTIGAFLAIPLLIAVNWLAFGVFSEKSYLAWYLQAGTVISLATGFLGLIWENLAARKALISANPAEYFGACLQLTGAFCYSLGTHHRSPKEKRISQNASLEKVWDGGMMLLLTIPIIGIVVMWVIVVAPLNYLVTLVSGAPARRALNVPVRRAVAVEDGHLMSVSEGGGEAGVLGTPNDISFGRNPLAVTQAMNALVLWALREYWV